MSSAAVDWLLEKREGLDFALLRQVREAFKAVTENQLNFSMLHESIVQLEKLIFCLERDEPRARSFLQALTPELIASVNKAYNSWQSRLEHEFAGAFLQEKAPLQDYLLHKRFSELIRRELALASGVRPQRMLVLGSGPLPSSAIHVHLQSDMSVDCVGYDPGVVSIARQVLKKCGFDRSVRMFRDGDKEYDASNYDLILIDLPARTKRPILRSLRKRRSECLILCRTSLGVRRLVYETTPDRDLRGFYVRGQQVAEGEQIISTLLLEAATSAATDIRLEWLKEITSDQATQILRLMNRTLEEETTIGFPGPLDEDTGHALIRQLRADVEERRRHLLVAMKGGLIVGQLILTPNSTPNHHHIVELTRGTIDQSFRGGGLAFHAFEEVARKCEELEREVICLDVRAGTMAAIWWQHFGFKPYGLLQDYSRVGEKRYQGLYLTQTCAELKKRIREIRARATDAAPVFEPAK
jgi:ribosomal protein S18 acetylase RimI-like enzyme